MVYLQRIGEGYIGMLCMIHQSHGWCVNRALFTVRLNDAAILHRLISVRFTNELHHFTTMQPSQAATHNLSVVFRPHKPLCPDSMFVHSSFSFFPSFPSLPSLPSLPANFPTSPTLPLFHHWLQEKLMSEEGKCQAKGEGNARQMTAKYQGKSHAKAHARGSKSSWESPS